MFKLDDNLVTEIIIGLFIAVILVLIMQGDFYSWLGETLLSYGASLFFLIPIALGIIKRNFTVESIVIASIGAIFLIAYAIILQKTAMDIAIVILQTILVLSVLSTSLRFIKGRVEHNTRKWWNHNGRNWRGAKQ